MNVPHDPNGENANRRRSANAKTVSLIILGITAFILGFALVPDISRCIVAPLGFAVGFVGLIIALLALDKVAFQAEVQKTAVLLKRSTTALIVLGSLLYLGTALNALHRTRHYLPEKSRQDVAMLTSAVETYKARYGIYPTVLAQLAHPPGSDAVVESEDNLLDPWRRRYDYDPAGSRNGYSHPDIWTVTPSGELIANWMPTPINVPAFLALLGFSIALAGLTIAFLGRNKKLYQISVRWAANTSRRIAPFLIVVGTLLYFGAVIPPLFYLDDSKPDKARADVQTLTRVVELFKARFGTYPATLEELVHPPDGRQPFLQAESDLRDAWGHPYNYDPAGLMNQGRRVDIWCVQPDGKLIGNWMQNWPSNCD